MEGTLRWSTIAAIAPIAWGTNYYVTRELLPPDHPLYGSVLRALPAGLALLALRPGRPHGSWWWRSLVLGMLNVGAFFVLIYLAAQLLPTSVAATVMATAPAALMLVAWLLISERPRLLALLGAALGFAGVVLLLFTGAAQVNLPGVVASVTAMVMSAVGYVLAKRWTGEIDVLTSTAWQLIAGGIALVPVALAVEGGPPTFTPAALVGFGYVTVIATAIAFAAWFAALRHLPAGTVGLVGLLNPVTGVLIGTTMAGEVLTLRQLLGLGLVLAGILLGQPGMQAIPARLHRLTPTRRPTAVSVPAAADLTPSIAGSAPRPS